MKTINLPQGFASAQAAKTLSPDQTALLGELSPQFTAVKRAGFSRTEVGDALADYFRHHQETITADRSRQLLQNPNELVFAYRQRNSKPNRLTAQQVVTLTRLVKKPDLRDQVQAFLTQNFVVDTIPPLYFKEIVTQLASKGCNPSEETLVRWKNRDL